jgi:rRNA maturation endonuclease Nob1
MTRADEGDLIVLRCGACGDTFPVHARDEATTCPTCGSADVHEASEPLL